MMTRKLLAALVGLSLAAGTLGAASAQTAAPAATQSASPSDATAPVKAYGASKRIRLSHLAKRGTTKHV